MSSRRIARRNAEVTGGEKHAKQRPIRKKIRDTTRLLSREGLPETVRLTQERILRSLKEELSEKLDEKKTKKMSKKYRMVKFFERRKVARMLRARLKLCEECSPEERADLERVIAQLRTEMNYIAHYPEKLKYQSLYPSSETTTAKSIARRESMLMDIAERVANGELKDASLELCSSIALPGEKQPESSVPNAGRRKPRRVTAPVDEEPDLEVHHRDQILSDDDFFLDTRGNTDFSS